MTPDDVIAAIADVCEGCGAEDTPETDAGRWCELCKVRDALDRGLIAPEHEHAARKMLKDAAE